LWKGNFIYYYKCLNVDGIFCDFGNAIKMTSGHLKKKLEASNYLRPI
jgi:hypothetical protein